MMGESRSLEMRVGCLERQNHRMRWLLLVLPLVALVLGAAAQDVWEGKRVVAEEVLLKDRNGNVRLRLVGDHVQGDGGPIILLLSADGKQVLAAGQNQENGVGYVEYYSAGEFQGGIGGNAVKK